MKKLILMILIIALIKNLYSLSINAGYLLYSYDYNYIYARGNVLVKDKRFKVICDKLLCDIDSKVVVFFNAELIFGKRSFKAKILKYGMNENIFISMDLADEIKKYLINKTGVKETNRNLYYRNINYKSLTESLLYFIVKSLKVNKAGDVYGKKVVPFIEGVRYLQISSLVLNKSKDNNKKKLFYLNKLWYYSRTGFFTQFEINLLSKDKDYYSSSLFEINYDAFHTRDDGLLWYFNFNSENKIKLIKNSSLFINSRYISNNQQTIKLDLDVFNTKNLKLNLGIENRKQFELESELWYRGGMNLLLKKIGRIGLYFNYEKRGAYNNYLNFNSGLIKNINLNFSYKETKELFNDYYNVIKNADLSISYSNKVFNLYSNYSLNSDLMNDKIQFNPYINLKIKPFKIYYGLIDVNIFTSLNINKIKMQENEAFSFISNSGLSLKTKRLSISKKSNLDFELNLEEFLDSENSSNYTSAGIIINFIYNFSKYFTYELHYNYQTRRDTKSWFIQGTSSQDITSIFKLKGFNNVLKSWFSISYNSKLLKFVNTYLNVEIAISRYWTLNTLFNYDFEFNNFSYNIMVNRYAGRINLRITYNSISKRFMLQIIK